MHLLKIHSFQKARVFHMYSTTQPCSCRQLNSTWFTYLLLIFSMSGELTKVTHDKQLEPTSCIVRNTVRSLCFSSSPQKSMHSHHGGMQCQEGMHSYHGVIQCKEWMHSYHGVIQCEDTFRIIYSITCYTLSKVQTTNGPF